ncbi:E3 ubiquitin-protein ligase Topors-like [Grus japonensis]|uniref:E3 ubiquitin-protein ligase Topors-like n=1 Tax=Grus japonensis TaxID=30415 RepID=A0ABC9Y6R4_GRUJA
MQETPVCPFCRRPIQSVRFSVLGEDDYLEWVATDPEDSPDASSQSGNTSGHLAENSPHRPVVSPPSSPQGILSPAEQGAAGPEAVGGLLLEVWAALFQRQQCLLDPVLPWLHQELEAIYGAQWWLAKNAESIILHALCLYGPDGEVMVQTLQPVLDEYAAPLVHGLIDVIMHRCSEEAWRLQRSHATGEEDNSPAASSSHTSPSHTSSQERTTTPETASSSSPASSNREEEAGISEAALHGCCGHPPSAPAPAEQEQPQEQPREVVAAAGPSARGCSCSPSAPGRGRNCSSRGHRRPPKRRAPSPQDSPQPCKRPRRRRH